MRVCILENNIGDSYMYLLSWLYEEKDVEEITFVKDNNQFMKLVENKFPDVAFIRLNDAQPEGLSILETLHEKNENTEVIFISKNSVYAMEAYKAGASGYLVEPIERKRFEGCFSKLLGFKR